MFSCGYGIVVLELLCGYFCDIFAFGDGCGCADKDDSDDVVEDGRYVDSYLTWSIDSGRLLTNDAYGYSLAVANSSYCEECFCIFIYDDVALDYHVRRRYLVSVFVGVLVPITVVVSDFAVAAANEGGIIILFLRPDIAVNYVAVLFALHFSVRIFIVALVFRARYSEDSVMDLFFRGGFLNGIFTIVRVTIVLSYYVDDVRSMRYVLVISYVCRYVADVRVFR